MIPVTWTGDVNSCDGILVIRNLSAPAAWLPPGTTAWDDDTHPVSQELPITHQVLACTPTEGVPLQVTSMVGVAPSEPGETAPPPDPVMLGGHRMAMPGTGSRVIRLEWYSEQVPEGTRWLVFRDGAPLAVANQRWYDDPSWQRAFNDHQYAVFALDPQGRLSARCDITRVTTTSPVLNMRYQQPAVGSAEPEPAAPTVIGGSSFAGDVPLSGTAEPGSMVALVVTDSTGTIVSTGSAVADTDGNWTVTAQIPDPGEYTVVVQSNTPVATSPTSSAPLTVGA